MRLQNIYIYIQLESIWLKKKSIWLFLGTFAKTSLNIQVKPKRTLLCIALLTPMFILICPFINQFYF